LSKLSSCEKFFIEKIAIGLEDVEYSIGQGDIESLLGNGLNRDDQFVKRIKSALNSSHSRDLDNFKNQIVTLDPSTVWEESIIKLYKGRETLLRDIVVEWYSKYTKPGFFDFLKSLFKGKRKF
jgi:hypothetical protein